MENIIFKQTKETVMTLEKTITTVRESLETVDIFGKKKLVSSRESVSEKMHDALPDMRRSA